MRFAPVLVLSGILAISGCGVRDYLFDLMEGEENSEPPAPLVEFAPGADIKEIWSESIGHGTDKQFLKLRPIAVDDHIYSAGKSGDVYALNWETGKTIWEQDLDRPITGGPGVGESLVILGTGDGEVIALGQSDGKQAWHAQLSSEVLAAPKAADGVVVARTLDGKIFGLDAANGAQLWVYDRQVPVLTLRGTSAPVLVRGLAIAGFDSGNLVALELKSGKVAWEANVAPPRGRSEFERMVDIDAEPLVEGDTLYIAAFQHGVIAVSLSSGRVEWTKDLSSYAGLGIDDDNVYLSDDKGRVWALDRVSGRAVWKQDKLQARGVTGPAVVDDYIVVGDVEGYLHWLSKEDGQFVARVRVDRSAIIAAPFSIESTLMAYSSGGTLSAYQVRGKIDRPDPTPEPETQDESEATEADETNQNKEKEDEEGATPNEEQDPPASDDSEQQETPGEEASTGEKEGGAAEESAKTSGDKGEATDKPVTPDAQTPTEQVPSRRGPPPSLHTPDWLYP